MGNRLKGKSAVVTGAGRGIGREIALALATEGADILVNDLGTGRDGGGSSLGPADQVVAEIKKMGRNAVANHESVADYDAAGRIIQACVDAFGKIDILCNIAGILRERMLVNMSPEEWDAVLKVHLYGTFNTTRHACVLMKEQRGGRIVNTTSDAGLGGGVGQSNYSAAKAGIVGFTKAIAREMGKYGVTCNAICPLAATRMVLDEGVKAGVQKRFEAGLISKDRMDEMLNIAGPEYVPPIAVYLATDMAAQINGQIFGCSGGRVALYSEVVETKGIYKDFRKHGAWTIDELIDLVPKTLAAGLENPAPPQTGR